MKKIFNVVASIGLLTVSQVSYTAPIKDTYKNGDRLRAGILKNIRDAINENDRRITVLEGGITEIAVDCSSDVDAFFNTAIRDGVSYTLTGMCNGPIWIEGRSNVSIQGDASGDKDDGILLPAGLSSQPYAALGIWQSSGVRLENLTVSAENYVSESYAFGNNVSALHVGNDAFAEVADVDFAGGDYAVHVYHDGQLVVGGGVTVTGFNLGGLTAYNHGLIRTLEDITVTGLVGSSTREDANALQATSNGIVEIRNGGSFAGPTFSSQDYRTTVWAGDNGTVRINNGANPTVIDGGVASGTSAMIRIEGNATITGYVAAYHMGYTQIAGSTQSGGLLEVGDGGFLRFDSSTLNPTSRLIPAFPVDVYRMGKLRTNNTALDLGGNDISVSGFGYINLRGATDLGGADVSCHERGLIFIRNTVTNVGNIGC